MSFMQKKYIETVQKIYLSNKLFAGAARLVVSLAFVSFVVESKESFYEFCHLTMRWRRQRQI